MVDAAVPMTRLLSVELAALPRPLNIVLAGCSTWTTLHPAAWRRQSFPGAMPGANHSAYGLPGFPLPGVPSTLFPIRTRKL